MLSDTGERTPYIKTIRGGKCCVVSAAAGDAPPGRCATSEDDAPDRGASSVFCGVCFTVEHAAEKPNNAANASFHFLFIILRTV